MKKITPVPMADLSYIWTFKWYYMQTANYGEFSHYSLSEGRREISETDPWGNLLATPPTVA